MALEVAKVRRGLVRLALAKEMLAKLLLQPTHLRQMRQQRQRALRVI
jgi:hypothetical protein